MFNHQFSIRRIHWFLLAWVLLAGSKVMAAGTNFSTWLDLGYRQDKLNWNIAGDSAGANPNVLSELQWQHLRTLQLQGSFEMQLRHSVYMRGTLGFGSTYSGDNQDSDYAYDNRQGEFSRSNNKGDGGAMVDASIGVGLPIELHFESAGQMRLIPLLGYAGHSQRVKMHDGVQTVSDTTTARNAGLIGPTDSVPPVGYQIAGLDSVYTANWAGVWLGVDLNYITTKHSRFLLRLEWHDASFYGDGDWNLRTDLAHPRSYEQTADGHGKLLQLSWEQALAARWSMKLSYSRQAWSTDAGLIRFFSANGSQSEQRLNQVNWDSDMLYFSVGYDLSRH